MTDPFRPPDRATTGADRRAAARPKATHAA